MTYGVRNVRGVSLIEALVALLIMSFGILGIAGMQATLRGNADLSRQRGEAVRMAQEILETYRNFSQLPLSADATLVTYAGILPRTFPDFGGVNATYARSVAVDDSTVGRFKILTVTVQWNDRQGTSQSVKLKSMVNGVAPELPGTVGIAPAGAPLRLPFGRSAAIPPAAVDQLDGTSSFSPPNSGTVSWVFNNASGLITSICSAPGVCVAGTNLLLDGFVRFDLGLSAPLDGAAESASSAPIAGVGVDVLQTAPVVGTISCFRDTQLTYLSYFCAVPVTIAFPRWAGRAVLTGLTGVTPLAGSISDVSAAAYRVCRYTRDRAQTIVPSIANSDHPLDYLDVKGGLTNQNFLVIRGGNGIAAFDCPADDPLTTLVNGTTWHHQPSV